MVEEEKPKEEIKEVESDPRDLISKANAAAERLEKANLDLSKLIEIQQKAQVEATLSGTASAGVPQPVVDENAEVKKFLKGTGYEDELFPDKN